MIKNNYKQIIEEKLASVFADKDNEYSILLKAMDYSLLAGGKRLRPAILLEFYKICGGKDDATDFAAAIEMIHTYSLIHDDLPCMDDDDFRRGRPSCHKQFDEANALLAGDGLLTHAFYLASTSPIKSEYKVKAIEVLSQYSGVHGMIGGQVIDLLNENKPCELNVILKTYELKTAGLLIASSMMGCILAGANEEKIQAAYDFAYNLGIAFQIQDDLLDYFGDEKKLGKPVGSDQKNDKHTYVSLVGIENAKNDVVTYSNKAIKALEVFGEKSKELIELTNYLITREF